MTTFEDVEKAQKVWIDLFNQARKARRELDKVVSEYNSICPFDKRLDDIDLMLLNISEDDFE